MRKIKPPAPSYRGPAAHTTPGHNKPIERIVLHSTVSPCIEGGAEMIARYFRSEGSGGSAHYVVDPSEVVQVVFDDAIAWHAPPNQHSIGIEMCDVPGPIPGDSRTSAAFKAARKAWRWTRPQQLAMLDNAAELTAQLCLAYDVPLVFVGSKGLREHRHGITTHNSVSQAFGQSTHWDPGFWPRRRFMRLVRKHAKALTA